VIIGRNGSGKSSLLEAIHQCPECRKVQDPDQHYHYFNSEWMNPHKSDEHFQGIQGSIIRARAMFSSHGETMRDVLHSISLKKGDCLLLDEPETGHDLPWTIKIHKGLKRVARLGIQIIAASHHPVFWNCDRRIELTRNYQNRCLRSFQAHIDPSAS
jgi:predicted ATPase